MFITIANDEKLSETVKDLEGIAWAETSLRERKDLRGDYREFIELSLISMGFTPPRGIYLMASRPMHHPRWTSKVLYSLKICIFHKQFKYSDFYRCVFLQ